MDIIVAQCFCLFGLFVSMVGFTLLPIKFVPRSGSDKDVATSDLLSSKYETLVGLANCLSGGVFLSTFFVGLLPQVRQEINAILLEAGVTSTLPPAELVVVLGFFLAMFVEQFAMTAKGKNKNASAGRHHGHSHGVPTTHDPSPRLRDPEDDDDGGDGTCSSSPTTTSDSVRAMAVGPSRSTSGDPVGVRAAVGDHHHGHSHDVEALLDPTSSGIRFGILLLSLGVHSLFEGMALGLQSEVHTLVNLFVGVWIHECLIAFALGFSMLRVSLTTCRFAQVAVLFSSLIPTGQLIGIVIGVSRSWTSRVLSAVLQAIAAGTFIQVTFLDIIPDGLGTPPQRDRHRLLKVFMIFFGFVCIAVVTMFVQVHAH